MCHLSIIKNYGTYAWKTRDDNSVVMPVINFSATKFGQTVMHKYQRRGRVSDLETMNRLGETKHALGSVNLIDFFSFNSEAQNKTYKRKHDISSKRFTVEYEHYQSDENTD